MSGKQQSKSKPTSMLKRYKVHSYQKKRWKRCLVSAATVLYVYNIRPTSHMFIISFL